MRGSSSGAGPKSGLRIDLVSPETATGDAARALASPVGGLALFRLMAHAEGNILAVMKLGATILSDQQLDGRSRELMVLAAMAIEGGRYEWVHHCEIGRSVGLSDTEIEAIGSGDYDVFSSRERSLLRFASALVTAPQVPDDTFADLRRHLCEREILEAIVAVGFYMMLARVTEGLGLGPEQPQGLAVMNSLKRAGAPSRN